MHKTRIIIAVVIVVVMVALYFINVDTKSKNPVAQETPSLETQTPPPSAQQDNGGTRIYKGQ